MPKRAAAIAKGFVKRDRLTAEFVREACMDRSVEQLQRQYHRLTDEQLTWTLKRLKKIPPEQATAVIRRRIAIAAGIQSARKNGLIGPLQVRSVTSGGLPSLGKR